MLVTRRALNDIVSKMGPVRAKVEEETETVAGRAKAVLASHRDRGDSRIDSFVARADGYVVLNDSTHAGAVAIEYGTRGGWVEYPAFETVRSDSGERREIKPRRVWRKPQPAIAPLRKGAGVK